MDAGGGWVIPPSSTHEQAAHLTVLREELEDMKDRLSKGGQYITPTTYLAQALTSKQKRAEVKLMKQRNIDCIIIDG